MKKIYKFIATITSCSILALSIKGVALESNAYNSFSILGYKLNATLDDCKCYYPTSIASAYGEKIMRGAVAWQCSAGINYLYQ